MHSFVYAGVSSPCVPVSTTETPCVSCKNWTRVDSVYEVAEAINFLIEAGYAIGCDGELLPPCWIRKAQVGADA